MKRILFYAYALLMFNAYASFAQPVRSPNLYLKGIVGKPTITPTSLNDYAVDWKAKTIYRSASTSSTSLNKWVTETDTNVYRFFFPPVIQGAKGDKGDAGVCPPCPVSGGTQSQSIYHIISNGIDDAPAIQRAVDSSYITGRSIHLDGVLKMSHGIKFKKDHNLIHVYGLAKLVATNTNTWTFFYSDVPASVSEAEGVYAFRKILFENLVLQGQGTQSGFDMHASEGAKYETVWCYDMQDAALLTFSLRPRVIGFEVNNSVRGLTIQSGAGKYLNATSSNSCSNGATVQDFRAYAGIKGKVGIRIVDASNVEVNGFTLEGGAFDIGMDYNNTSGTSTGLQASRGHFEGLRCTTAVINIRSGTSVHTLDHLNFIKPSIFVRMETASGYPFVNISNIANQRILFNGTDKIFTTTGGASWKFSQCDEPFRSASEITKMFNGVISEGCGIGSGANRFCITDHINR
jgi:hypothetical protein